MVAHVCKPIGQDCKAVHPPCPSICPMKPIFWPPSVEYSAEIVTVFMVLSIVVSAFLYVRHERRSLGVDWDFPKQSAWGTSSRWVHPVALLMFRLGALGLSGYQLEKIVLANPAAFSFFTLWNFSLLALYFATATAVSIMNLPAAVSRYRHDGDGAAPLIAPKTTYERVVGTIGYAGLLERAQLVMFEIELPTAMLVTVVFWTVLAPQVVAAAKIPCTEAQMETYNKTDACTVQHHCTHEDCLNSKIAAAQVSVRNDENIIMHACNTVLMLVELALNRLPMRRWHCFFPGWWATIYALFQTFVWFPLTNQWMYTFMNTGTLFVIPWFLGLLAGHYFFYFVAYSLSRLKSCGHGAGPNYRHSLNR